MPIQNNIYTDTNTTNFLRNINCPSSAPNHNLKTSLNNADKKFVIHPNPSSNYFIVKNTNDEKFYSIKVFSFDGKLVEEISFNYKLFFGHTYTSGMYIVKIYSSNELVHIGKIVKY